jgi:polyferredoxin
VLVHALIALHVAHWMSTGSTLSPLEPSEAMEFSKHDLVNAGFVFFGLTILSTLVLGRWFCGWACHLVALQDLCLWLLRRAGIRPRPLRSRVLALVPALAALYMFAWPLVYRIWSGEGPGPPRVALTKTDFWATFPPWPVALATFAVCGFAIVYFLGAKGFCTYACPYGAIFGLADRFAVGRIRVTDACEGCAHCTATCTSNVLVHQEVREHGMVVDPGCMKCLDCVSVCPKNALYFGFGKPAAATGARAAHRAKASATLGEELFLGGAFLAAFLTFRGLYGVIPFLLALGLAGILAFCFGELGKLLRRPRASFLGRVLKQDGRLTRSGLAFLGVMLAVSAASAHSAFVQVHARRSARAFEGVRALREAFLVDPARELDGDARARVEGGRSSAELVRRYGLLSVLESEIQLAWLHLLAGSPGGFEQGLRSAAARAADPSPLHYDLGRFLEARGRSAEAALQYEAALAAHASAPLYDRLARLHWAGGRPEEALALFARARAAFPASPDLGFNHGVALALLGRAGEAIEAFREVLELDPGRVDALENLAGLLAQTGQVEEARALERRAMALRSAATGPEQGH